MTETEQNNSFSGMYIPSTLLSEQDLSWTEKILIVMINDLSKNREDYCFASNRYLAELLNLSHQSITNAISNLKEKQIVKIRRYHPVRMVKIRKSYQRRYLFDNSRKSTEEKIRCIRKLMNVLGVLTSTSTSEDTYTLDNRYSKTNNKLLVYAPDGSYKLLRSISEDPLIQECPCCNTKINNPLTKPGRHWAVEYWNDIRLHPLPPRDRFDVPLNPGFKIKHPNPSTKSYRQAAALIDKLCDGTFLDKKPHWTENLIQFFRQRRIPVALLTRPWSQDQIFTALDRLSFAYYLNSPKMGLMNLIYNPFGKNVNGYYSYFFDFYYNFNGDIRRRIEMRDGEPPDKYVLYLKKNRTDLKEEGWTEEEIDEMFARQKLRHSKGRSNKGVIVLSPTSRSD